MSDPDESVWVVFNGEIYNFPELRRELEATAMSFGRTRDTEVIVNGYKQWGDGRLRSPQRHVRPGDLGCTARAAAPCARPVRDQTALLQD